MSGFVVDRWRRRRRMFGTDDYADSVDRVAAVLGGTRPIQTLQHVRSALSDQARPVPSGEKVAFGVDANVLLAMHNNPKVADYFAAEHRGLLVLPGQAVQEFWNNRHSVGTAAAEVKSSFLALKRAVASLADEHKVSIDQFESALKDFENQTGFIWAPGFRENVDRTFQSLVTRAVESRFPRERLGQVAKIRQSTKTPPGFKDSGDGDLNVWADFLLALLQSQASGTGSKLELAVFLTHDKKSDWGRGGIAHPVLAAEVHELTGLSFETWDLRRMGDYVDEETAA